MASKPRKIVVLGMMAHQPVAGIACLTMPYVAGLERLGYEAYYVEAHGCWQSQLMSGSDEDGSRGSAEYIDRVMRYFGLPRDRWAFQALHSNGCCYGMSHRQLERLYKEAALIINMHGGTPPRPEHVQTGRLLLLDSDPVGFQLDLHHGDEKVWKRVREHFAHYTWGENIGQPDCRVPVPEGIVFRPTRVPVLLDLWQLDVPARPEFTTIGNWEQSGFDLTFEGEVYRWSKHHEFEKFLDLPSRAGGQKFELALAGCKPAVRTKLEDQAWRIRDALEVSLDIDTYRRYIASSRGEFTVAKDQNVRLRSGWFSDRSATYLAAGKPVITQETGFSNALPTGEGLFGFSTMDEILAAVEEINGDYERHSRAARQIAREYFDAEIVLGRMLDELGLVRPRGIPPSLVLTPASRRPLELHEGTVETVRALDPEPARPEASVVAVAYGGLVCTKLCLESILANTESPTYELIVVDNGSDGAARDYLGALELANPHVRVIHNAENAGFARALNQGLEVARGQALVLLNNDVIVPPRWLHRLVRHLHDRSVGLVGPVTNRSGNEGQIDATYETYGEFVEAARARAREHRGIASDIPTITMFCAAMRRDAYERIGPLDERFEIGLLEDDDYSRRAHQAGYRVVCAENVLVHHFGEASFGKLVATGEYNRILAANKARFEEKWGEPWEPYGRREDGAYEDLLAAVRRVVGTRVPRDATVLVVTRGDDRLLELDGRRGWHFPQDDEGVYAGHHPADGADATARLKNLRAKGAGFLLLPRTGFWWLDQYPEFREHLNGQGRRLSADDQCILYELSEVVGTGGEVRDQLATVQPPAAIEILSVEPLSAGDERLAGFAIHRPQAGDELEPPLLKLSGWVVGRTERVTSVEIIHNAQFLRRTLVNLPRLTVAEKHADAPGAEASGFSTAIGVLGLPPEFKLSLQACFDGGATVPIATISGRREPLRSVFEPRIQPLMVTSLGRTGTTWALRLLSEHPDIVVERRYPYEVRLGRYWMHVLKVLSEPANHLHSSHPYSFHADQSWVGHNPFFTEGVTQTRGLEEWLARGYPERLAAFAQETIDGYYRTVAAGQDQHEPRYFAEKHLPDYMPWLMWELYRSPAEVFLVRDPRDMFLSMLAFNAKRGSVSFGRERVDTDEEFLQQLRADVLRLLEAWKSRSERAYLLRYEDLIQAPLRTLTALFEHLGVDASRSTIADLVTRASADTEELAAHRTSVDPSSSVGRWRMEASKWQDSWEEAFGDMLPEFGYE